MIIAGYGGFGGNGNGRGRGRGRPLRVRPFRFGQGRRQHIDVRTMMERGVGLGALGLTRSDLLASTTTSKYTAPTLVSTKEPIATAEKSLSTSLLCGPGTHYDINVKGCVPDLTATQQVRLATGSGTWGMAPKDDAAQPAPSLTEPTYAPSGSGTWGMAPKDDVAPLAPTAPTGSGTFGIKPTTEPAIAIPTTSKEMTTDKYASTLIRQPEPAIAVPDTAKLTEPTYASTEIKQPVTQPAGTATKSLSISSLQPTYSEPASAGLTCPPGYHMAEDTGECFPDIPGGAPVTCPTGYVLDATGHCIAVPMEEYIAPPLPSEVEPPPASAPPPSGQPVQPYAEPGAPGPGVAVQTFAQTADPFYNRPLDYLYPGASVPGQAVICPNGTVPTKDGGCTWGDTQGLTPQEIQVAQIAVARGPAPLDPRADQPMEKVSVGPGGEQLAPTPSKSPLGTALLLGGVAFLALKMLK